MRRTDSYRVPAAGAAHAKPAPRAAARPHLRPSLGLRLRTRVERATRLRRLPAAQAAGRRRTAAPAHRARSRLRVARARVMTLRTRIAAAAGVAVALAVVGVSIAVYVGVRGELRNEIDDSLRDRADAVAVAVHSTGSARAPRVPSQRFGGPEGHVQLVLPSGRILRDPAEGDALPADGLVHRIARNGSGEEYADTTVDGLHLRVLTIGIGRTGALQIARPLDEVDRQVDRILLLLLFIGAGGVALGVALGAGVARTALAPIGRFTRRTEE